MSVVNPSTKPKRKSKFLKNKSLSMSQQFENFNSSFSHGINEQQQQAQEKNVKRQLGVFEQFKIKYDQVRNDCETKRKQIEQLNRVNKRQQIQLLNVNTAFYDKQIKRLRQQVEKVQQAQQDYKDKYFVAENKRKELQASDNVKSQEIKKMIKNIESLKVQNVELKHQMKQKEKQYLTIIRSLESSSQDVAERYSVAQKKLNQAEGNLKSKIRQLDQFKLKYQKLQKNKQELSNEQKKIIEKYKALMHSNKMSLQQTQDSNRKYRNQIIELRDQIEELRHNQQNDKSIFDFSANNKLQSLNRYKDLRVVQGQNRKLEQANQALKAQNKDKKELVAGLKKKLDQLTDERRKDQTAHQEKIIELQNKKNAIEKHYQTANLNLQKQLQILRINKSKGNNESFQVKIPKTSKDSSQLINNQFQELFNSQVKETKVLKQSLNIKIEQIYNLKNQLQDQKIKQSLLKNQIDILKKKSESGSKNTQIQHQIQIQNLKNDIQTLKRKYQTLQTKLASKIKEIKQKDSFIANTIIGKSRPEDAPLILSQIQRVFESDYVTKLSQANAKIKKLQQIKCSK